jgi:hypothetical protein
LGKRGADNAGAPFTLWRTERGKTYNQGGLVSKKLKCLRIKMKRNPHIPTYRWSTKAMPEVVRKMVEENNKIQGREEGKGPGAAEANAKETVTFEWDGSGSEKIEGGRSVGATSAIEVGDGQPVARRE